MFAQEFPMLPDTPVKYFSIMRTHEGIPEGIPIWSSFQNEEDKLSLKNEAISSTILSLAKNISGMADDIDEDGKIITISIDPSTYNIFLPFPGDKIQMCFVIAFESSDTVLIKEEYKIELVHLVAKVLRENSDFKNFLMSSNEIMDRNSTWLPKLMENINTSIKKWDKSRVEYLVSEQERQRKIAELEE